MAKTKDTSTQIATNRKAQHDYFVEERIEAGVVLQGWEVKSARERRVQIAESYVVINQAGVPTLLNAHFAPCAHISSHTVADPLRSRPLLLHRREISRLLGLVQRKGYTLVALSLYWSARNKIKLTVGLARGKKQYDKRQTIKERDWARDKLRLQKHTG